MAEPEPTIVHASANMECIFGHLPHYLRKKKVLSYSTIIRIRRIEDLTPRSPSTSGSPSPPSSDGESGHDGHPNRSYRENQATGPRIFGFVGRPGVANGTTGISSAQETKNIRRRAIIKAPRQ